ASSFQAERVADGFEPAGHRETGTELRARGVDSDCFDLNCDRACSLAPPGGGLAAREYAVAAAILDADAWINLPVAKTHGCKITACMKNHFGLLPSRLYGWDKSTGTARHAPIPHSPAVVDEAWVDLWEITREDLDIVDLIHGSEAGAFSGEAHRANLVLATRNPVAGDLVVARLMGFNPDDFEFAPLAAQQGVGPGSIDQVEVRGAELAPLVCRFRKAGSAYPEWTEWQEYADYGMTPRLWTLLGPLPRDHAFSEAERRALVPGPGEDGWSPVVWFGHDKIDLGRYYGGPANCAAYAFTGFHMPRADSVRYWAGSDEGLTVWIDGEPVYDHHGRRRHRLGQDRVPGYLEEGEHRLLVRVDQSRGDFEFSFSICEPVDDPAYAGNTYFGLRYAVGTRAAASPALGQVGARDLARENPRPRLDPQRAVTATGADPLQAWDTAPESLEVQDQVYPTRDDFAGLAAELAGVAGGELDSLALTCLSRLPFQLVYLGFPNQAGAAFVPYGPDAARVLGWMGLRCGISLGRGRPEAVQTAVGWVAQGRPVLVGHEDGWASVRGYRQRTAGMELLLARPDEVLWKPEGYSWTGRLPGGVEVETPVLTVEAGAARPSAAALADSLAAAALEMARRDAVVLSHQAWGDRTVRRPAPQPGMPGSRTGSGSPSPPTGSPPRAASRRWPSCAASSSTGWPATAPWPAASSAPPGSASARRRWCWPESGT
ncbi:MAG: DUF362 domain-containing protein, partial [Gemmatimonadota bacterium]